MHFTHIYYRLNNTLYPLEISLSFQQKTPYHVRLKVLFIKMEKSSNLTAVDCVAVRMAGIAVAPYVLRRRDDHLLCTAPTHDSYP